MNCENSHLYILFFNQETIYMAKQSPVSNLWPSNPRPPHLFKSKQLYFNLFYILGFCTRALLKNMNLQLKNSLNTALEISEIIERSKQTPKSCVWNTILFSPSSCIILSPGSNPHEAPDKIHLATFKTLQDRKAWFQMVQSPCSPAVTHHCTNSLVWLTHS